MIQKICDMLDKSLYYVIIPIVILVIIIGFLLTRHNKLEAPKTEKYFTEYEVYKPNEKSVKYNFNVKTFNDDMGLKIAPELYISINKERFDELFSDEIYYSSDTWTSRVKTGDNKYMGSEDITGVYIKENSVINIVYLNALNKILFIVRVK